MFTAKIMYCLWVTLAQDDDTFVLETTKSLPKKYKKMSEKQQKEFIRERILGKSNEELVKVFFFNDPRTESRIFLIRNLLNRAGRMSSPDITSAMSEENISQVRVLIFLNENYFRRRGVLCEVQLIAQRLSVSYLDI